MAKRITVVGAGIFGLACGWELARRGARVTLLEAAQIGAGSSGGTVGALAPHVPENWNPKKQMQLEALVAAESWWAGVAAAGGIDPGYARAGRVQPAAAAQEPLLRARISAAAAHWPAPFGITLSDNLPPGALAPLSPDGLFLTDTLTARLAPRAALSALAAAIRAAGGEVVEGCGPLHPDRLSGGASDPVIWATGAPGLAALSDDLGRVIGTGVKGQSALLRLDLRHAPQVFADGVHIVPHGDGTVAIGSTSERDFTDPSATDTQLDALIGRAIAICPALAGAEVIDRWAGVRPRAVSRAPLIGPWPGRAGHLVVNGGFKIGFGMAPAVAAIVAALALDQLDRIPDGFRLT